jgi:oxygen-independent coproporphyrinogen-3 oxidase
LVDISLYFHIPFCTKKCPYCHFYVIPDKASHKDLLGDSVALEWKDKLPLLANKKIVSIYFGGGTPTLYAPDGIAAILERIDVADECEITIEANPEDAGKGLFKQCRSLGINRMSLGVQSLDDRSLLSIERGHAAKKAKEAISEAHHAGFDNLSIDLMYDLPSQTEASWQMTLDQIDSLPISHLSLYNLTIEPHTSFYKRRESLKQPDPEMSLCLLNRAVATLEKSGLKRYEISAFGRPSCHNMGYWTGRPFLGFGPSAFSYWNGERFRNVANLQRYARALKEGISPVDFSEHLSSPAAELELLAVRLRLLEPFEPQIPLPPALDKWMREGYIGQDGKKIYLTDRGTLFYDSIASDIVHVTQLQRP